MDARTEYLEIRPASSTVVTTGTLACPGCDAPVSPPPGRSPLGAPVGCAYCGRRGAVRDFLSLAQPTRAAHVVLHARLPLS
jgi:hypothetical protein